jgi:DNA-binding response OmpR family regulator
MSGEEATEAIVYRFLQILLAAQISLGGQHGNMTEKELNLLQFPSSSPGTVPSRDLP